MTGNIAADVEHVIATTCAADAQERLMSCVPMLEEAIENWRCGPDTAPPGSLVVAASTPLGGIVFHTSGWPEIDEAAASEFGAGDIAVAVSQAIENGNRNDMVLAGFSVLLGTSGVARHIADATKIVRAAKSPLTVLLIERQESTVAWMSTTIEVESTWAVH
jgi:hypothetical protein